MLNGLLSGPNPKFNALIERIKVDIDSGIGLDNHMLHDDLATAARAKYNNMVASDEYSKLDPKDAKILALTTKVTALERYVSANPANMTSGGGSGGGYRGNQGEKLQVWKNGALSTKVPPSNMRGRQYGGVQVINIRTDYLMASKFVTKQKIIMHGLKIQEPHI